MKCKSKLNNRNAGLQRYTDIKKILFCTLYIQVIFYVYFENYLVCSRQYIIISIDETKKNKLTGCLLKLNFMMSVCTI